MENRVLVAYATATGVTGEIAEAIGEVLREAGSTADVVPAKEVADLSPYSGVVVGSGVRVGKPYAEIIRYAESQVVYFKVLPEGIRFK